MMRTYLLIAVGILALAALFEGWVIYRQRSIRVDAKRETMRATLLRAISHDLRTPLTGILSAGTIIGDQADALDTAEVRRMAADIKHNAEWLLRMVENLLAVTRISGGVMRVNKTVEVAEEVMAQSASIVRKRFPECRILVKASEEPLLVPMDAILISQVLINLLENAVKYSPPGSPIWLHLYSGDGCARFEVCDCGRGIPGHVAERLFEAQIRERAMDSPGGMGIGLSICKAIADAHSGSIKGSNRPEGGAVFSITLPLTGGKEK